MRLFTHTSRIVIPGYTGLVVPRRRGYELLIVRHCDQALVIQQTVSTRREARDIARDFYVFGLADRLVDGGEVDREHLERGVPPEPRGEVAGHGDQRSPDPRQLRGSR